MVVYITLKFGVWLVSSADEILVEFEWSWISETLNCASPSSTCLSIWCVTYRIFKQAPFCLRSQENICIKASTSVGQNKVNIVAPILRTSWIHLRILVRLPDENIFTYMLYQIYGWKARQRCLEIVVMYLLTAIEFDYYDWSFMVLPGSFRIYTQDKPWSVGWIFQTYRIPHKANRPQSVA